jgi:hypothetical protein
MDRMVVVSVIILILGSAVLGADYLADGRLFFVHAPHYDLEVKIINTLDGGRIVSKRAELSVSSSSTKNDIDHIRVLVSKLTGKYETDRSWFHKTILYKKHDIKNNQILVLNKSLSVSELTAGTYIFTAEIYTGKFDVPLRTVETTADIDNIEANIASLMFSQYGPGGPKLYGCVDDPDTYRYEVSMSCYRDHTGNHGLVDSSAVEFLDTTLIDIPIHGLSVGNYTVHLTLMELDGGAITTTAYTFHFTFEAEPPTEKPEEPPIRSSFEKYPNHKQPAMPIGPFSRGGCGGCGGI